MAKVIVVLNAFTGEEGRRSPPDMPPVTFRQRRHPASSGGDDAELKHWWINLEDEGLLRATVVDRIDIRVKPREYDSRNNGHYSNVVVTLHHKGRQLDDPEIREDLTFGSMQDALLRIVPLIDKLDRKLVARREFDDSRRDDFRDARCMQPGCPKWCTVVFRLKKLPLYAAAAALNVRGYRAFCDDHRCRGSRSGVDNDLDLELFWDKNSGFSMEDVG